MDMGPIDSTIQLAGIDKIQQRITEIENKIGIGNVSSGDFQTLLQKAMQRSKVKATTAPVMQKDKTTASSQTNASSNLNAESLNKNANVETFGANAGNNSNAVNKSDKSAQNKSAQSSNSTKNSFPGAEALPGSIMNKAINPFSAFSSNSNEKVNPEDIDVPTRDTKRDQFYSTEEMIEAAANKYDVDSKLVKAIAIAESNMNQNDISDAGAIGVMQLMPETARGLGVNPYDEQQNIEGGAKYLRQMLDTFGGNVRKAVAAYNAGPGAVQKYGGIPPYGETQHYVGKVMDLYR